MGSVPGGPGQTEGLISQPNNEKQGEGGLGVEFPEAVGAVLVLGPRAALSWVPVLLLRGLCDFEKRDETVFRLADRWSPAKESQSALADGEALMLVC